MNDLYSSLKAQIFDRGRDDWVSMSEILQVARDLGFSDPMESALEFAIKESESGSLVVGKYTEVHTFEPWPETGIALGQRLKRELDTNTPHDPLAAESTIMIETKE